jgi:hypothetical protein
MDRIEHFKMLYGPHFTYWEFVCECPICERVSTEEPVDPDTWFLTPEFRSFMALLIRMRGALAFPFIVNSGHRCRAYNASISSTGFDGPHTKGAADLKVAFERAYKLNKMAAGLELGIGLQQTGDIADRYIHVDNQGARLWTY